MKQKTDISLPLTILESLQIELLKKITVLKGYKLVHLNLLINHPNQNTQEWHQDNGKLGAEDYYTLLIPLTDHPDIKKTEVLQPYTYKFSKTTKVVVPSLKIGDGLLFSGCLWHRGMPNYSNITRYCLYAIIVKNEIDEAQLFEGWK